MGSHRFKLANGVSGIYTESDDYKPGDRFTGHSSDYLGWHAWAEIQHKAGLRQKQCARCAKWVYPQDMSDQTDSRQAFKDKRRTKPVTVESPVCLVCTQQPAPLSPDTREG